MNYILIAMKRNYYQGLVLVYSHMSTCCVRVSCYPKMLWSEGPDLHSAHLNMVIVNYVWFSFAVRSFQSLKR
jgi:hypothetical protein